MTELCKTFVPASISEALEQVKDKPADLKAYGVQLATEMCREILREVGSAALGDQGVFGLHFYTLNSDEVVLDILHQLQTEGSEEAASGESENKSSSVDRADVPVTVFTSMV